MTSKIIVGTSSSKDISLVVCASSFGQFSQGMRQTEEKCSSCNTEEYSKKFSDPDPGADDFQNSEDSFWAKFS